MAANNSFPSLLSLFILLMMIASTLNTSTALSTAAEELVACTMCDECENPCKLPPPPPPPVVIECPPPPLPVVIECPPPPSLPPPLPPPPPVETSPPPPMPPLRPPRPPLRPRPPCPPGKICVLPPPRPTPYAVGYYNSPYFQTGTPRNYDYIYNKSGKLVPFSAMLVYVAFLSLPYYLFII